jgi:AcrR family transcriptional regulator
MLRVSRARVKTSRTYDSTHRRERAERRRLEVLEAAGRQFLSSGYATTTVTGIAAEAGVSVETVYKAFGSKAGLVRELWHRGLLGAGPVPAETRSDAASSGLDDPRAVIRRWSELATEVAPRAAPVMLMIRAAAGADVEAAQLWAELRAEQEARMEHNARAIARHLRPGLSVEHARDVMLAYTEPQLFHVLVVEQGWSIDEFADFQRRGLEAALL